MTPVFADTFYWIALLDPADEHHERAAAVADQLKRARRRTVTTEGVLVELLAFFADKGPYWRNKAAALVQMIRVLNNVRIVPQTTTEFDDGLRLYAARPDKGYSLTDCISLQVMTREGLTEALTNDHHFEQEGFRALFRDR